jgi:hypothetical protein
MDLDLARHVVRAGFRAGRELEALLGAVKRGTAPEEYATFARAVATAIHEIQEATLNKAIAEHPSLESEIEGNIAKYGRYL